MLLNIEIRKDSQVNNCYNCQYRIMSSCALLDIRIDSKDSCDLYCPSNIRVDGCGCKSDEELLSNGVVEIDLSELHPGTEIEQILLSELSKIIPMPIIELTLDKDSSSPLLNMYRGEFKTPEASYNFATRGESIIGWRIKSSSNLNIKKDKIKK